MNHNFEEERSIFRKWLAGLDYGELLDVSEDIKARLDYMAERIEIKQFKDFMERNMK